MPCEVLLARLFALTPAEARLARCLSKGISIEEAAAALNIKVSTARTQLIPAVLKSDS
jgi:DNA-binding CsgD family transcriptional regulator